MDATCIRDQQMNDDFYSQFEQSFRGQRDEIKERLQVYAPFIGACQGGCRVSHADNSINCPLIA